MRDTPRSAVATCLRASGAPGIVGLVGRLARGFSDYDLLRAGSGGIERQATARLPPLSDCPAVAADPSGHALVAAAVERRDEPAIEATVAAPGGTFGKPVTLARLGQQRVQSELVVGAISPRGDALVAWIERRYPSRAHPASDATRISVAIRPAGGAFGPARRLTPWQHSDVELSGPQLAAGFDAAGAATLAWVQGARHRSRAGAVSTVAVATAPPGGGLGPPQTLTGRVQGVVQLSLDVAPDGAALLAHDGEDAIWRFERQPGAQRFERLAPIRPKQGAWSRPVVALAPGGAALVAWRPDDVGSDDLFAGGRGGVVLSERPAGASFSKPRTVWPGIDNFALGESDAIFVSVTSRGVTVPPDLDNTDLRASLAADGRYVLAWGDRRRSPLGDRPTGVRVAAGTIGGPREPVRLLGCACRDVNGVAALEQGGGAPGVAVSDNATWWFGPDSVVPHDHGRLGLLADLPAAAPSPPPAIAVPRPRPARLKYDEQLHVKVSCASACDLRAYVVDDRHKRARGVGTATLPQGGPGEVAIRPRFNHHLAPAGKAATHLLVRAWAPGTEAYSEARVPIRLSRVPLRPLPQLLEVRAVRAKRRIVVTWRTSRPTNNVFLVTGRDARKQPVGQPAYRFGGPHTPRHARFRVVLHGSLARARSVLVLMYRSAGPHDHRQAVAPISE